jgi:UDP-N-acetylglucosamine acyltransferase
MPTDIHPTAIIDPKAELADGVKVGPYSIIGPDVEIGENTEVASHVVIEGHTKIGKDNRIFQFTSIGAEPQSTAYKGEPTRVEIGDGNTFREYCTVNRGTVEDNSVTRVEDNNFIMAYVHIAHDCRLGSNTIFANCASLAGHVEVGDYAIMGGFSLVHQFCRVGAHCITGIGAVCIQDVPPFTLAAGNKAITHGINVKGLRRRGFDKEQITNLKRAYKLIYRSGLQTQDAIAEIRGAGWDSADVNLLIDFINGSKRGVIR